MAIPVIYRGDDTDFGGRSDLALKLTTAADLDGCTVEFTFFGQRRTFTGKAGTTTMPFVFTSAETASMPVGTHKAKVRVFDASGRVRTVEEPKLRVTDDIREAYSGGGAQEIAVEVNRGTEQITTADVFDCSAGVSDLKERIAYLWEKCGGTVINRDALDYGADGGGSGGESDAATMGGDREA